MSEEDVTASLDDVFEDGTPSDSHGEPSPSPEPAPEPEAIKPDAEANTELEAELSPEVKPEPSPSDGKDDQTVPLAAVMAERSKRQAAEARLAELEKPADVPTPDVLEDQDKFVDHVSQSITQQFNSKLQQQSEFFARREFGDDVIEGDMKVFEDIVTPEMYQEVINAPSPYHALHEKVEKYQQAKEMENIDEYKAKIKAELKAELEAEFKTDAEKKAKEAQDLRNAIPTSLAGKPSAGALGGNSFDGPAPLDSVIGE